MYLVETKAIITNAMQNVFTSTYPVEAFRDLKVSLEYPATKQDYPSIWSDFEPVGELEQAGIGHTEYIENEAGEVRKTTRWRFGGYATYTCVALTSRERDLLFDQMVRVFAFTYQHPSTERFREVIETNNLIGITMGWGKIGQRGFSATVGTPWDTDETLYEATIAVAVQGEFVLDPTTDALAILSEVRAFPYTEGEGDPTLDDPDPENPWV